jgi:hypothetical protein
MKNAATRIGACALTVTLLSSCSWFHRGSTSCREPVVPASPADAAALKVAPGQDLPDTRNAVKVPALNEPEKPRSKNDPCLSRPPSYVS